jgi:CHAD domain-containing protein
MMEKIQQDPSHSVYEELLSDLKKQRDETVGDAVKYASTLKYSPRLRVSIKRLAESDLKKRFGKIVGKYQARIKNRTRIVVKDSEDKDELHRLREDARRLRYTLELDKEDKTLEEAKALKEWQDILGAIHDSDIFIRRLEKMAQTPQISSLLKDEVTLRNRNYEKFRSLTA